MYNKSSQVFSEHTRHAVQLSHNKLNINPTYTKLAVFYTQHEVRHEYI